MSDEKEVIHERRINEVRRAIASGGNISREDKAGDKGLHQAQLAICSSTQQTS